MNIGTASASQATIAWIQAVDMALCHLLNRADRRERIGLFFAWISRLGDGVFWYSLILLLPLIHGRAGWMASLHMLLTGLVTLLLYRWLKSSTGRPRPCAVDPRITPRVAPLDEFSFPSGHTLHAVGFSVVLLSHFPAWFWIVIPFATLVAISRPVLGLHYPSDVAAAVLIGFMIGKGSILLFSWLPGL